MYFCFYVLKRVPICFSCSGECFNAVLAVKLQKCFLGHGGDKKILNFHFWGNLFFYWSISPAIIVKMCWLIVPAMVASQRRAPTLLANEVMKDCLLSVSIVLPFFKKKSTSLENYVIPEG